eukprot:scaffold191322_cov39-Tisochrysis_lutea.AAC.1
MYQHTEIHLLREPAREKRGISRKACHIACELYLVFDGLRGLNPVWLARELVHHGHGPEVRIAVRKYTFT